MKHLKRIGIALLASVILCCVAVAIYAADYYHMDDQAASAMEGSDTVTITKEHGTFYKKGSFLITAVYHPSALLRDPSKKEDMLKDMLKIAEEYKKIKQDQE